MSSKLGERRNTLHEGLGHGELTESCYLAGERISLLAIPYGNTELDGFCKAAVYTIIPSPRGSTITAKYQIGSFTTSQLLSLFSLNTLNHTQLSYSYSCSA